MLCVKCGHQAALLSGSHSDAAMETINKLTRYCWRKICNNFYSLPPPPLKLGSGAGAGGGSFQNVRSHSLAFNNNSHSLIVYLFMIYLFTHSFIDYYIISYLMISLILSSTVTRLLTSCNNEPSENSSYPVIFKYLFIFV